MRRYDVPALHTKEFHDTDGVFKKWSKAKKQTFAEELFSLGRSQIFGLSASLQKQGYAESRARAATTQYPGVVMVSPYGACFSSILASLILDPKLAAPLIRKRGLAFLVESGNKNNAEIEWHFSQCAKAQWTEGALRSISFVAKDSCRAIQLADFYAFYSRRHMSAQKRGQFTHAHASPYYKIIHRHVRVWEVIIWGDPFGEFIGKHDKLPLASDVKFWWGDGKGGQSS
jgi:hypothetical protein